MQTSSVTRSLRVGLVILAAVPAYRLSAQPTPSRPVAQPAWTAVDRALGRPGATQADGVRRYSFPRSDLKVQLDGVTIKPALALGSWVAFEPDARGSTVMGDLVLTADEVKPVMSSLLKGGIRVTAVHNHLLRSSPTTMSFATSRPIVVSGCSTVKDCPCSGPLRNVSVAATGAAASSELMRTHLYNHTAITPRARQGALSTYAATVRQRRACPQFI